MTSQNDNIFGSRNGQPIALRNLSRTSPFNTSASTMDGMREFIWVHQAQTIVWRLRTDGLKQVELSASGISWKELWMFVQIFWSIRLRNGIPGRSIASSSSRTPLTSYPSQLWDTTGLSRPKFATAQSAALFFISPEGMLPLKEADVVTHIRQARSRTRGSGHVIISEISISPLAAQIKQRNLANEHVFVSCLPKAT